MTLSATTLIAYLLVYCRCSAMMFSAPVFGNKTTPTQVRIFATLSLSGAIAILVKPDLETTVHSVSDLAIMCFSQIAIGLLIGSAMNLIIQAAEMAGSLLDIQIGLSMSQVLNPAEGIEVSILSQYKQLLATVIFLSANAHHLLIQSVVGSFHSVGFVTGKSLLDGVIALLGSAFLIAIQIAAPVMAVSLIVDASLGLVNRAVPQLQALMVGAPAKLGAGMLALTLCLPPLVSGVTNGAGAIFDGMNHLMVFTHHG